MSMKKTLYCIRHGEALHNILFKKIGEKAYVNTRDTRLVENGTNQAIKLGQNWKDKSKIDLVVVSPLTRTLETASHIFNDNNLPMIALESLKEYPQSYQQCNHRRTVEELKKEFPHVDFKEILHNDDKDWRDLPDIITDEKTKLKTRISNFKYWVNKRNENNIAVVCHSSYLNMMMNNFVDNETTELKHCYPYKYYL